MEYIDKEYFGDAFKWELSGTEFISTAKHSFVVGKDKKWKGPKSFKRVEADKFYLQHYNYVPTYGVGSAPYVPLSPLERLGIAVQADGDVVAKRRRRGKNGEERGWSRYSVCIKKERKINFIEELFTRETMRRN